MKKYREKRENRGKEVIKKSPRNETLLSCMKRVASPGSKHDTGCLGLVYWDDPEGWNGEGGGRRTETKELSQESKVGTNTVVSSSQGSGNEEHRS